jgi:hypothetical protein
MAPRALGCVRRAAATSRIVDGARPDPSELWTRERNSAGRP